MASLCTFQLALHQPQRLASREDCLTALDSNKLGKTANHPPEKGQVKSLTAADMVDDPTRNVQLDKHSTNASNPSPAPWLQLGWHDDKLRDNPRGARTSPVPAPMRHGSGHVFRPTSSSRGASTLPLPTRRESSSVHATLFPTVPVLTV